MASGSQPGRNIPTSQEILYKKSMNRRLIYFWSAIKGNVTFVHSKVVLIGLLLIKQGHEACYMQHQQCRILLLLIDPEVESQIMKGKGHAWKRELARQILWGP